jgi:hypothetical protein
MRLLLDRGAEVKARNDDKLTPLLALLREDEHEHDDVAKCVQVLVGGGADVNAVDEDGRTPLAHAVVHGFDDVNAVCALLHAGARGGPELIDAVLDDADDSGIPPNVETLDALLDAGAGASFDAVSRLAEAATDFLGTRFSGQAEACLAAIPRVLSAAERALDDDEGARMAARLAAAVEADRRDVASGLRALITGAAAERRRLEAAREAAAQERHAAAAERVAAEERRAAAAAEREAAAQERRAVEAERAELLRLRAEVEALAGGGGAAIAAEGAGGGGGGEAGPLAKRSRGG